MDKNTLLPVRIKGRGDHVVGNEAKTLSRDSSGFTKTIVAATAGSIIKCPAISSSDIHAVADELDTDLLEFESYVEEVDSRFGRPVLQIVQEEGEEAYDELRGTINDNPYLHAAVKGVPVWEAVKELDCDYKMVVPTEDGERKLGAGYGVPPVVSVAVEVDGDIKEVDLRDFIPDFEWVIDNWKSTGGRRGHVMKVTSSDDKTDTLAELTFEEAEETLVDSYIRFGDRTVTVHHVKEREESITEDEDDRLAMGCGSTVDVSRNITKLTIDVGRLDGSFHCGNCRKHLPAPV